MAAPPSRTAPRPVAGTATPRRGCSVCDDKGAISALDGICDRTLFLTVTDIATFVGLRQCGRYLRLSLESHALGHNTGTQNSPSSHDTRIDEAIAAAGSQLENDVATELLRRNPNAPHVNPRWAAETLTPWAEFLHLLAQAQAASSGSLSCWAAEVVLQGRPTRDSVVNLSGRADFILLLWRDGRPVLRIVECKASLGPQTKFIVQLVLYRMLLLQLLSEAPACFNNRRCICIGGREWQLPGGYATGGASAGPILQVECLLCTKAGVSGAEGHAVDGEALPPEEVQAMTRQLSAMLMPGGRIAQAVDCRTPLEEVPYELDSHCGVCRHAAACWTDSAARGVVQLAGCSARQAEGLVRARVCNIEDLASLLPPSGGAHGAASAASGRERLEAVAVDAGIAAAELHRLVVTANVRAQRCLKGVQQQQQQQRRPAFQLLPGAPLSCMPSVVVRESLVRVYLSVAVDVVLRRVVGIAAHVAAPVATYEGSSISHCGARDGATAPSQAEQTGWDVVLLLEGVVLDSDGAVASTAAELDALEARLLADFSDQLCSAIQGCAERLQQQSHEHQRRRRRQQQESPPPEQQQELLLPLPQSQSQPHLQLHFYVHSHNELRELIRRCSILDELLSRQHMARTSTGRTGQGRDGGSSSSNGSSNSKNNSGSGASRSRAAHAEDLNWPGFSIGGGDAPGTGLPSPVDTADDVGCLFWLPHLLGLRPDIGVFADEEATQEQAMVSVLEDEVRRYATVWHGAGRLAATSVAWGGDGVLYGWRARPPQRQPVAGAADTNLAETSPVSGASRSITRDDGNEDLRTIFAQGGYLSCLAHRPRAPGPATAKAATTGAGGGSGENSLTRPAIHAQPAPRDPYNMEFVQLGPDVPGASIPPGFFRELWSRTGGRHEQGQRWPLWPPQQQQLQQQQVRRRQQVGEGKGERRGGLEPQQVRAERWAQQQEHTEQKQQGHEERRGLLQRCAAQLRSLLLAQAHGVRWLEERLVRLPRGGSPHLRKVPLSLPPPLGRSLRSIRFGGTDLPGGPRRAPQGPQAPRASALSRAALDALWLNRGEEIRQFWRALATQTPAARAAEVRSGAIVLGKLRRMNAGKKYWLLGHVAMPEGCRTWDALAEATGLEEGSCVVVTAVKDNDPWVLQDEGGAMGCCAYGAIWRHTAAGDSGGGSTGPGPRGLSAPQPTPGGDEDDDDGGLWVECRLDTIRLDNLRGKELFLRATPGVWPWTFAGGGRQQQQQAARQVVLDAAPNISAWVAMSAVECLREFGGSSAYLAERMWLSLPLLPDAAWAAAGEGEDKDEPSADELAVCNAGPGAGDAEEERPRTPSAVCNDTLAAITPTSLLRGQQLLSPPLSPASPEERGPPSSPQMINGSGQRSSGGCAAAATALASGSSSMRIQGNARASNGEGEGEGGRCKVRPAGDGPLPNCYPQQPSRDRALLSQLDGDQVAVVQAFLMHSDGGSRVLLQGPPGTGKTETVAVALLAWLKQRVLQGGPMGQPPEEGGVVLLNGPTHTAVDNLMKRIATRLREQEGGVLGTVLGSRVMLVRVDGSGKPLDPALAVLGVTTALPTSKAQKRGTWYLVGGTLRHLVKQAKQLRTLVATHSGSRARELMEVSGLGSFAAALVVDEASMVFAPHLLALCCLLVVRGSLLVAGDHQQLSTIVSYDFAADQRPNLMRHQPYVNAYEYVRLLAAEEMTRQRRERERRSENGDGHVEWIGGAPPPVSVCSLSYTHRLPQAVRTLIQPLYSRDGITLRGRPPSTPIITTTTTATATAGSGNLDGSGGAWRRLWQQAEGLFLVVHNEDRSSKLNLLEVQLVAAVLEARPSSGGAAAAALGGAGGQGSAAAAAADSQRAGVATAASNSGCSSSIDAGMGEGEEGDVCVAVITPHRAQQRALRAMVRERGWGGSLRVETVERMQGGEAETVIFSATASDVASLERSEEFYSSICRANVAFSRTRRRLIVVASRAFLEHLPTSYNHYAGLALWRQLCCMCEERGTYLGSEMVSVSVLQGWGRRGAGQRRLPAGLAAAAAPQQQQQQEQQLIDDIPPAVLVVGRTQQQAAGANAGRFGRAAAAGWPSEGSGYTYRCDVYEAAA